MKTVLMVILIKGSLIMSALLLVSVTAPTSSAGTNVITYNLEEIRTHNMHTLKHIENEFTKTTIKHR